MKASEIRELSIDKIRERLDEARENEFRLRFEFATGQLTDHNRLKVARREIARIATVLREVEQAAEKEASNDDN
jgi:large subunit ribosomal protein L29